MHATGCWWGGVGRVGACRARDGAGLACWSPAGLAPTGAVWSCRSVPARDGVAVAVVLRLLI